MTIFMVFRKHGYPADDSPAPWKLYFTTDCVSEIEIKRDAERYGWRVVKVALDAALSGHCEAL